MSNQILIVKEKLNASISQICDASRQFVKDPSRDYTRVRSLTMQDVISLTLCLEGATLNGEMLRFFGFHRNTPSSSAFIQQRSKLNEFALPSLFHSFVNKTDMRRRYKGYRLLAADGSDLQIPLNPHDATTYFPSVSGKAPYSMLHLDAVYDLLQRTYVDASVCGRRNCNEKEALSKMIQNSSIDNALIIADRGYESYNLMAHIQEKGWKFLIRIKDLHSTGIASGLPLPTSSEFDAFFPLHLTKQRTTETRELLQDATTYKLLCANAPFDFLPSGTRKGDPLSLFYLPFRVVKFSTSDDTYETVVTNLNADEFPPQELKRLYHMRWGIETSFRELKYTLGLLHVHAKKVEYIIQELFARLIMYNFSELITSLVVIQKCNRKYPCKANFTVAVQICRQFFLGNVSPPDVEAIISKNLSVIRSGRSSPRNLRDRRLISFTYRIA